MAHFPSIIPWINDMLDKDVDRDHFYTTFATIRFDVLVCLDTEPYEMLIGARGLNWACTLTISQNFEMQMNDYDFYSLKDKISPYLKHNGNQKFGSYIFLKYLCDHSPNKYRKKIINPSIVRLCAPRKATNIDEADRTVFYRWMPQSDTGRTARNYEKTEFYFGKNVADYCREHNISSQWVTEEQAKNMNIKINLKNPWD